MPLLTLDDRTVWFAHCPKAGGTSIERVLVGIEGGRVEHLHWGWDKWFRGGGWKEDRPPCSPQHLVWTDAVPLLERAPDKVFAVVRDPADRLQSEWRWQRTGRRGTRLGKALARLPFSAWLPIVLAMAERNAYAFDNHLRPQSDFVPDDAQVFRLEDGLNNVFGWLSKRLDRELPCGTHLLKTDGKPFATEALNGLIVRAHRVDYARFGYVTPDCPERRPPAWARLLAGPLAWLDRRGRL